MNQGLAQAVLSNVHVPDAISFSDLIKVKAATGVIKTKPLCLS